MKQFYIFLIILLASNFLQAQKLPDINYSAKLSDSISNFSEIRIYKVTKRIHMYEIFRMFQETENSKWKTEFIDENEIHEHQIFSKKLESKSDVEKVWLEIKHTDILDLPQEKVFEYKRKNNKEVFKKGEKYSSSFSTIKTDDGVVYFVMVKSKDLQNFIRYENPEFFLEHYPNINEYQSFQSLLNIIRDEFEIWTTKE